MTYVDQQPCVRVVYNSLTRLGWKQSLPFLKMYTPLLYYLLMPNGYIWRHISYADDVVVIGLFFKLKFFWWIKSWLLFISSRESKKKLMELMQQWSEWHSQSKSCSNVMFIVKLCFLHYGIRVLCVFLLFNLIIIALFSAIIILLDIPFFFSFSFSFWDVGCYSSEAD